MEWNDSDFASDDSRDTHSVRRDGLHTGDDTDYSGCAGDYYAHDDWGRHDAWGGHEFERSFSHSAVHKPVPGKGGKDGKGK